MYRTAARRLLSGGNVINRSSGRLRKVNAQASVTVYRYCSSQNPNLNFNANPNQILNTTPHQSDSDTSTSSSSTAGHHRIPRAEYQDEQARVLSASLRHVMRLGWTEEALIAGARDAGVSPALVGSFPRKEAALVEFFMDECLQLLIDRIESGAELQNLVPSERITKLVRIRLEAQAPYISKWPQALSIQAHPSNVTTSFKQRAALLDEIWHAAGDESSDIDWYAKRTVLGGIYSTTEIYMLTDSSPDFRDTWAFLDNRVKDAFDLKKSIQEAQYLAEAVGAGIGNSLKRVFQGS
ncbi:Ubiquinone biosynthesis protein COQ9 mitochondrial [Euphorbia peplus]|nr:Ubiquinone biosynthesis protein COQ9 mitochondrial [Euphorbia peplus]